MLEEKISKKVQFGRMCAFIPAGVMHRTTVVGKRISYQSIYIDSFRMKVKENKAVMFNMSSISRALVDELTLPSKHHSVIIPACFELFLKTAERDMENESSIMTLIIPKRRENMLLADYIEKHFRERISMKELKSVIPYTERHINRIYQYFILIFHVFIQRVRSSL